jgi:heme-degrading monooxygenase HmoA
MSVVVLTKVPVSAATFESVVKEKYQDVMLKISKEATSQGCLHHMFTEDDNGQLLIVDEWDELEHFQKFFQGQTDVKRLMEDSGLSGAPVTTTERILDIADRF